MSKGFVYFILAIEGEAMRCKIGFTTGDPLARMKSLQCGSPVELRLHAYTEVTAKNAEAALHDTFAPLRMHGEWFNVDGKLRDFLCYLRLEEETPVVSAETFMGACLDIILSDHPPHPSIDRDEYLATADTKHFDCLREPLANDIVAGLW